MIRPAGMDDGRRRASRRTRGPLLQRGSAVIEYSLIASLGILVLVAMGDNVILEVINAVKEMYQAFTSAISMTYPTPD